MRNLKTDKFINKSNIIHNFKYNYDDVIYINSSSKVSIFCDKHGKFEQEANSHLQGKGCPDCSGKKKKTTNEFITESNKIHKNKYDYSLSNYINNIKKVTIICKEHGEFEQAPKKHISGQGCPNFNNKKKKTNDEFILIANKIHKNKYLYDKVTYINSKKKVTIICKEHGEFEQTPNAHIIGYGCEKCCKRYSYTEEEYIKVAKEKHQNKYNYSITKYKNAQEKIEIICNKHGIFSQNPSMHLQGNGCPNCRESKGEFNIAKYLDNLGIKYIRQYKFDDCINKRKLPFDFYLPKHNICIEFDGKQHFITNEYWGGDINLQKIIINDNIKNKYCETKNIILHRIKYTDNIDEKLFKILK